METPLWILASLAIAVVVLWAGVWVKRNLQFNSWVDGLVADSVVVHTRDNSSIRGVMMRATDKEVILREAQYLQEGLPEKLQGEIGVPRTNIAFIQRLSGAVE